MNELRRNLELLVNTIRNSMELETNDENSIRIELMEVFEPLVGLLRHSVGYLQRPYEGNSPTHSLKTLILWANQTSNASAGILIRVSRQGVFEELERRHGGENQRNK